jgi:hypothetical protein
MNKKLAIKGHQTRGKEVIGLLKMLGGKDGLFDTGLGLGGTEVCCVYYIGTSGSIIYSHHSIVNDDFIVFTLEEFLAKYPFKIGDKVTLDNKLCTITWMCWECNKIYYYAQGIDAIMFQRKVEVNQLKPYKETNMNEKKFGTAKEPLELKSNAVKLVDNKVVDNLDEGKTMSKKLAIRGHATRGNEVIEILKMLGGKNKCDSPADNLGLCYLIDDEFDICAHYFGYDDYEDGELNIFTLEEFLEKYPFKVGDKVFLYDNITLGCITGMKWEENTVKYCVYTSAECWCDVKELLKWNAIDLVEKHYKEQCEELLKDIRLKHLYELGMENIKDNFKLVPNKVDYKLEYKIPDGLEFDVVVDGKIILKPIKPKYPTTYAECKEMMGENVYYGFSALMTLQNLIICRDVYWKIAGEQMGLDKPWKPDLENEGLYCIQNYNKQIIISNTNTAFNKILIFPTEEMRNIFYENFKDLIEQCKELL